MKQTKLVEITDIEKQKAILEEAGQIIRDGGLVVFPTETVYGIGANGLDADACRSIYVAKGRPSDNPLILTVPDEEGARQAAAVIPPTAQKLMDRFWPGPLTIVLPRKPIVPDAATGGLDTVALRCPDHDICRAFLRCAGVPVAGPSANLSTRPSPTTAEEVMHDMDGRVDMSSTAVPATSASNRRLSNVTATTASPSCVPAASLSRCFRKSYLTSSSIRRWSRARASPRRRA